MSENYFGEDVAARYDETLGEGGDPRVVESTVEFLAKLSGGGAALELGIGTGRIALPLAARGVRVAGIDLSEAMVARLRAKRGGDDITVVIGDFAATPTGTTHVRTEESYEGLVASLLRRYLQKTLDTALAEGLHDLKAEFERAAPARTG